MAELTKGPEVDFSPGPDCYQRCQDWVEECNLLLNGPLASKSRSVKANYVRIWAGKPGRMHIKSLCVTDEERQDPNILLETLLEWTKPKSNALATAAAFRRLEQGNLSLAEYIDKATILCDQCEYPPEACDRMLRDDSVVGLRSCDACYKCIEKGSSLSLDEAIGIAQNADATVNQVRYMRPEFSMTQSPEELKKSQDGKSSRKTAPPPSPCH